jgi:hypothetical protein
MQAGRVGEIGPDVPLGPFDQGALLIAQVRVVELDLPGLARNLEGHPAEQKPATVKPELIAFLAAHREGAAPRLRP